ncbi:GNAT family N-acetyltransferase [Patescibacteria group bacterium]|nr:GNAT family N-acetyltransferase [Patescibacteria group bacterium]
MKVPILKGQRVTLRPLKVKDAENYVRWFSDREVMKYFNQAIWKISLEDEKTAIRKLQRSKTNMNWAIELDGKHIGGTGFKFDKKEKTARWGIIIGEKKEWGKGYAVEAAKLCANYVFTKLKYERMDLLVDMGNKRALNAYTKTNFVLEGILRSDAYNKLQKKRINTGIMSILKDEWRNN